MMTVRQRCAYVTSQAVAMQVELEAMKAANTERESEGLALAYDEKAFMDLITRYGMDHNTVVMNLMEQ